MGSRAKNFRRRAEDDDANGEEATTTAAATTKASSKDTFAKTKKHHQQAPKLLSFADEEESQSRASSKAASSNRDRPASRVSKSSSSSHKIISLKDHPSSTSPSLPSNVQPQAGEYTKEKLRELQKNTRTLASSRPAPSEPKPPSGAMVVLKGLVKPISAVEGKDIMGNKRGDEEELEIGEELNTGRGSSSAFKKDKDEMEYRLASMGIGKARDSSDASIPDQATINAIRAKRERLRQIRLLSLRNLKNKCRNFMKNASAIIERREADNADEMMEVQAALSAAMAILNKGGDSTAMIAAATTAAQAASAAARERSNLPVQLDEFGRDVNLQKRMDMMRRAEVRKHRKSHSESKRMPYVGDGSGYQHKEGESSTDESDSESTAYQSNRDLLLQTAGQIFSNASEEYSQLSVVKERLERWKKYYSSSYRDAYMSLSSPAIFSPYFRLELLKWDPLHDEADFNDMQWHYLLFSYGLPEDENEFNPDDADANLVPRLVEKIALPILHHEIAHCWDMLSTRETKNAVAATNLVINYVPATSEALRDLLAAIHSSLSEAVTNLIVPTWTASLMKAVPRAARVAAYRFGMSARLLRNICLWKDILALPVLEDLALDQLLKEKVLPHVQNIKENIHDAVTRTERIIASLSGIWAGPNGTVMQRGLGALDYGLHISRMLKQILLSKLEQLQ
ncbi:hypothetical protein NE237_023786 [Protea cynaroides]|uniref:GCF C-terminal domain-containing protein n=1 Tax=Protea cynaroides TaxID=273540 RepID=A0A9Q0HCE8_9MAGN|nr:hypothetical protein NE237_023786 [Protea cynaroides]